MLRRTLLYLSTQRNLRRWVETSAGTHHLVARFIAGQTLEQALGAVESLTEKRIDATLDFLGENVRDLRDVERFQTSYTNALSALAGIIPSATVSLKPTQFGMNLSEETCRRFVEPLVAQAAASGTRVEIDMESSIHTDSTLRLACRMHQRFPGAVRTVIQASLRRSETDIAMLNQAGIPVRLCKGAYREAASVAFQRKHEVDRNYLRLMKVLLDSGTDPAIATHDEVLLAETQAHARDRKLPPAAFGFQMLYGVRRDLQENLARQGFRMRVYVPFGDAWYPYFMRRLAERPANLMFLLRNLLRP